MYLDLSKFNMTSCKCIIYRYYILRFAFETPLNKKEEMRMVSKSYMERSSICPILIMLIYL
jgi:hypothetical protein